MRWVTACAALALWAGLAGTVGGEPAVMSVVAWNLHWFPSGGVPCAADNPGQIAAVQRTLRTLAPDVLVVQEARDWRTVEEHVAKPLGLTLHVVSRFPVSGNGGAPGPQQVAIMSRWPARSAWSQAWEPCGSEPPRGFAFAALDVHGLPVLVYTFHFKSNLGDPDQNREKREEAARQLVEHAREMRAAYGTGRVILAGDLNTDNPGVLQPSERTLQAMTDAGYLWTFQGVAPGHRVTFPGKGKYPPCCLDHIFVAGLGRPVAEVIAGAEGSDHLPVRVTVLVGDPRQSRE